MSDQAQLVCYHLERENLSLLVRARPPLSLQVSHLPCLDRDFHSLPDHRLLGLGAELVLPWSARFGRRSRRLHCPAEMAADLAAFSNELRVIGGPERHSQ